MRAENLPARERYHLSWSFDMKLSPNQSVTETRGQKRGHRRLVELFEILTMEIL